MSEKLTLDKFYRCSACGTLVAVKGPGRLHMPPCCSFAHDRRDMQEIKAEGYVLASEEASF